MKARKGNFLVALTMLSLFISACSKKDNSGPSGTSHKVIFKAEASAGSTIDLAVYGYDSNPTTVTSLSGTTWTSPEITAPAGTINLNVGVNARGASAASTLKVQILVDGVVKKEGTSSGSTLSASASYAF